MSGQAVNPRYKLVNFEHESETTRALYGVSRSGPCWLLVDNFAETPTATLLGTKAGSCVRRLVGMLNEHAAVADHWVREITATRQRAQSEIDRLNSELQWAREARDELQRSKDALQLVRDTSQDVVIQEIRKLGRAQSAVQVNDEQIRAWADKAAKYDIMAKALEQAHIERDTAQRIAKERESDVNTARQDRRELERAIREANARIEAQSQAILALQAEKQDLQNAAAARGAKMRVSLGAAMQGLLAAIQVTDRD